MLTMILLAAVPGVLPGPSIALALRNSCRLGPGAAVRLVAYDVAGAVVLGCLLVGLVGEWAARSGVGTSFRLVGAAILILLGVAVIASRRAASPHRTATGPGDGGSRPVVSFVVGLLNPKSVVFFSLLAAHALPGAAHEALGFGVHIAVKCAVLIVVAVWARSIVDALTSSTMITWVTGAVLIGYGISIAAPNAL